MKKTALFFLAFALVLTLGAFAQAQEQTPPPPKPVTAPVPAKAVIHHPGGTTPMPHPPAMAEVARVTTPVHAVPVAATIPHMADVAAMPHPPAVAVQTTKPLPMAPMTAPMPHTAGTTPMPHPPAMAEVARVATPVHAVPVAATIPHMADVAAMPHPPGSLAQTAVSAPTVPLAVSAPTTAQAVIPHAAGTVQMPHPPAVAVAPSAITQAATPLPGVSAVETLPEGQTPPPVPQTTKPTAAAPQAKHAPELRTEIIKFNYLDLSTVQALLKGYRSPYGRMDLVIGGKEKSIVVTDTPEIVEKMISVVRDADIKPVEIQFTVQLIQGTETETPGDEALKNDPVIRELRSILKYKSFTLLDGTLMRVIDGEGAEAKFGPNGEYAISLQPRYTKDGASESVRTEIRLRKPQWISQRTTKAETKEETQSMQIYYNGLIETTLQLKLGEKTVVGVSKSDADKGLILILSTKIVK